MSSTSPFTILFVQGSWHVPAHAEPLTASFKALDIECIAPLLPSNNVSNSNQDPSSLPDAHVDSACVQEHLERLVTQQQRNVLLVAHSYGGLVATMAAHESFSLRNRSAKSQVGGLLGIFYVCTFSAPVGAVPMAYYGHTGSGTKIEGGIISCPEPETLLFNDLDPEAAKHWSSLLVPQSVSVHYTACDYAGYEHVPCGYLYGKNDRCITEEIRERLLKLVKDRDGEVKIWYCDAGHEPQISWTEGLRDVLVGFAKDCLSQFD
ncbi:MAG: hypothetical protein M1820_006128 [Bogoriella megaspora]|nr:MAG: hypothetical protein M1820_006128 [Bogoriella megaspora]